MQIDCREQSQICFICTRSNLCICVVDICLNFLLQSLQCRQIFCMYTSLRYKVDFTRNVFLIIEVMIIKWFFRPVENCLQCIKLTMNCLYLWICLSIVIPCSFCSIRICCIPYQVIHDSLELTTGNQCITAYFSILFNNQYGSTVLNCLSSCTHTCTTGTDYDNIICFFDVFLCLMFNSIGLEFIHICSRCLLSSIIQCILDSAGCECSTGYNINTGTVCFNCFRNHDVISRCTNMSCFLGFLYLNICNCIFRECYFQSDRSVVTVCCTCVSTCCVCQSCSVCITLGSLDRLGSCILDTVGRNCSTSYGINFSALLFLDGCSKLFKRCSTNCRCFVIACYLDICDLILVNSDCNRNLSSETLCFSSICTWSVSAFTRTCDCTDSHQSCKHHLSDLFHDILHFRYLNFKP